MKITVVGAGAMGLRYGVLLQEAGNDVDFVEPWEPSYRALKSQGGAFVSRDGNGRHLIKLDVYQPQNYHEAPDLLILFVKQMETERTMAACQHFIGPRTYVLTNQNGMGAVEVIEQFVPQQQIIAGTAFVATVLNRPGDVNFMGDKGAGHTNLVNVTENPDQFTKQTVKEFEKAGMNPTLMTNYKGTLWDKMMLNSVINTLCTLMDTTMGQYQSFSSANQLTQTLVDEAYQVADAEGVKMLKTAKEMTRVIAHESAKVNPLHRPSMYQDMVNNRPTEVDYINGYIAKKAREHGMRAPQHELLVHLVHLAEEMRQYQQKNPTQERVVVANG